MPLRPRRSAAISAEREVVGVQPEAVVPLDAAGERGEHVGRELDNGPAPIAHDMVVGIIGEVVHRRTVAEVDVVHHVELGEPLKRAVDGRQVDVGIGVLHGIGQRLGCDMTVRFQQRGDDRPPRPRHPPAVLTQTVQDLLEPTSSRHALNLPIDAESIRRRGGRARARP